MQVCEDLHRLRQIGDYVKNKLSEIGHEVRSSCKHCHICPGGESTFLGRVNVGGDI